MSDATVTRSDDIIPADWSRKTLSALGDIRGGSTPRREVPEYWNGDIPWVTPGELTGLNSKYISETRDYITRAGLNSATMSLLPRNSLLVTTRATLGSVALAAVPITTNQGFRSIVFRDDADPHFFFHLFPRLRQELVRRASGTTFLEISGREFGTIEVPVPPLDEQRRIAEILDSLDAVIQKTEEIVAKLNAVGRGLLQDLMTRGLGPSDKLRDPREEPNQFRPSLVGLIPKQWRVQPIKEFCSTYAGGTPPRDVPRMFGGSIPWVKSSEVNKPTINATEECLTELGMEASSAKLVPPKTPLLAMYGATAGTISWLEIEATTNQAVLALVPNRKIASSRWLYWALQFYSGRLVASVQGSGQPNLSKKLVDSLLIAVPSSLTEQGLISNILDAHMERVQSELRYLNKLRLLKQGLMDDLLTGRVRVPVHEEVAS